MHLMTNNLLMDITKNLISKKPATQSGDTSDDATTTSSFEIVINKLCNRELNRIITKTPPLIESSLIDRIIAQEFVKYNQTHKTTDASRLTSSKIPKLKRSEPILSIDRSIIAIFYESFQASKIKEIIQNSIRDVETECNTKLHDRTELVKEESKSIADEKITSDDESSKMQCRDIATRELDQMLESCDSDSGISTVSSSLTTITTILSSDNVSEDSVSITSSKSSSPESEKVDFMTLEVKYEGYDILDLASNLMSRPWNLQYSHLPLMNLEMFWQNRSQYHRLGNFGQEEFKQLGCANCDFQFPIPN